MQSNTMSDPARDIQPVLPVEGNPRRRGGSHGRLLSWLAALLLLATVISAVRYTHGASTAPAPRGAPSAASAPAASGQPADRFMQSVVTDDGALGWQQLCPSVQTQISRDELAQQTRLQHTSVAQAGLTLSVDFVGARVRPEGGELRLYVVTARWPTGASALRTYSVLTQPSGCVADVQHQ